MRHKKALKRVGRVAEVLLPAPLRILLRASQEAVGADRERRAARLLAAAIDEEDGVVFETLLHREFLKSDSSVTNDFVQAVRAATDAVDPIVIESMGRLFRKATLEAGISRRGLRGLLRLLETLDTREFLDIRQIIHGVMYSRELLKDPERTGVRVTAGDKGADGLRPVLIAFVAAPIDDTQVLCRAHDPGLALAILAEHRLAVQDEEDYWAYTLDFDSLKPLREVMPIPVASPDS